MRAVGGCTVQQTLTTEAASVLKHSLTLARRRGHAQVTPLHVAATLLTSRSSVLRRACLKSQPHLIPPQSSFSSPHSCIIPLHCRALELCFNVALNRLPTTPSSPLLQAHQPSLSNALVAALKRAQAHQRRGCIEQQQYPHHQNQNQQPPILAIKVELEQLILSILDDPSVSRVMREAGFSSTAVKTNLEDYNSASPLFQCGNITGTPNGGGIYSSPCSPSAVSEITHSREPFFLPSHFFNSSEQNPLLFSPIKKLPTTPITADLYSKQNPFHEDIKLVFEVLLREKKRRNTVIIGDSVSISEGLVAEIMGKIERGDGDVPEELKSAHFIKFQFSSVPLRFMRREEVDLNLSDLKRKVDTFASSSGGGEGVIVYTGDLKWTVDGEGEDVGSVYSPVDHLVAEIGRLLSECGSSKVWLMATANYQTYMRCQVKQPPLEIQWALQAVSVPSGGLGLSLNATSLHESRMAFSQNSYQWLDRKPFSRNVEHNLLSCCAECTTNYEKEAVLFNSHQLPCWLQSNGAEAIQKDDLGDLRRKWNRLCYSLHQGKRAHSLTGNSYSCAPSYPGLPNQNNVTFPDTSSFPFADSTNHHARPLARFRRQQSCHIDFSFSGSNESLRQPNLDSLHNIEEGKEVKITLALGNSLSSDYHDKLEEAKGSICKVLNENVPWQSERIPSIVNVLIGSHSSKKETWLLIQGNDSIGKRRLALAIAESVFGSADLLLCMNMRKRDKLRCSEILQKALKNHEKLVVLVEDIDFADAQFVKFLSDGFETGNFGVRERSYGQVIFVLTKGSPRPMIYSGDDKKIPSSIIHMKLQVNQTTPPRLMTPNSGHKRKGEWDISNQIKIPKTNEKEETGNTLDLNIRADEEEGEREEDDELRGEFSPNSSDLTLETSDDRKNPFGFIELIDNQFILDRNSSQESLMRNMLLSKIKGSFEDVCGNSENMGLDHFTVEEMVLEGVLLGCRSFLNSLFEKWLKDVFQTSLQTVKIGGKGQEDMSRIRLCLAGKGGSESDDVGFMGSDLPKTIEVSFMN